MAKTATKKEVTIINIYRFKNVARICFEVLSSDEITHYNTCFSNDAQHASCNCPATSPKGCYHINQLRPRAQEYFDSRQPAEAEDETPGLVAAEQLIADLKAKRNAYTPFQDEWKETSQFGNRTFSLLR